MKLIDLRKQLKDSFTASNIDTNDADFIIASCLGVQTTQLWQIDEITPKQQSIILKAAKQRIKGKPTDIIFKHKHFYGLDFEINRHVLTPRQDSEIVVDEAIKIINANKLCSVLDLCCGSGCLATAIAKNTKAKVTASDVSSAALKVAKHNAKQNKVEIKFVKSNMFKKIDGQFDLIISNPPYIETSTLKTLDKEVQKYDPCLALDGGADGLNFYRTINTQAAKHLNENGFLVLEIGFNQKQAVKGILSNFKFEKCVKDFGGNNRVMIFRR